MSETNDMVMMVDLDSLLDTRITTINTFGADLLKLALKNKYHDRFIDRWESIDPVEYANRYNNRNKQTLKGSFKTQIIPVINEFVKTVVLDASTNPFPSIPKLIINTYPYDLTDAECSVIIQLCSKIIIGVDPRDINIVHMSVKQLIPAYLKAQVNTVIMYEWYDWLKYHQEAGSFKNTGCPNVYLVGPAIFKYELPTMSMLNQAKEVGMSHFEALAMCVAPMINLSLLPSSHFSIDLGADANMIASKLPT